MGVVEAEVLVAVVHGTEGIPCSHLNALLVVGPASGMSGGSWVLTRYR